MAHIHSIHGTYKGVPFRSLLELRFLKFLERHNIDINRDVVTEPGFAVWYYIDGKRHQYIMDFHILPWNAVYEVKHSRVCSEPVNVAKFAAAEIFCEKRGLKYLVWTEKLMDRLGPDVRVTTKRAQRDPDVVLSEKSVANHAKQRRRAKRARKRNAGLQDANRTNS